MNRDVETVLRKAGWSPDREVSIDHWVDALDRCGITVHPKAARVLRNFAGLVIHPVRRKGDRYAPEPTEFDPLPATEPDDVLYWEVFLNKRLTPIAHSSARACKLLAETGEVFSSWDNYLFKVGESLDDALENCWVFANRKPVEIAEMPGMDKKSRPPDDATPWL